MNASTATIAAPGAIPRAAAVTGRPRATRRPKGRSKCVDLERGNVLRIHGGRDLHVTPVSGVLWITEEQCLEDTVLKPGETYRIANTGLALVFAHRGARVMLAMPRGMPPPNRIDVARADGEPGGPVAFRGRGRSWLDRLLRIVTRLWSARTLFARRTVPYYGKR